MTAKHLKLLALIVVPLAVSPVRVDLSLGIGGKACRNDRIALVEHLRQLRAGIGVICQSRICYVNGS